MGVLSRYMTTPGKENWTTIKRVFRYLCGMIDFSIFYNGNSEDVGVHGFIDSDWAGDIDDRRLNNGYVFRLFGDEIYWMSRKQSMVAFPSTKAKYIVSTDASKKAV